MSFDELEQYLAAMAADADPNAVRASMRVGIARRMHRRRTAALLASTAAVAVVIVGVGLVAPASRPGGGTATPTSTSSPMSNSAAASTSSRNQPSTPTPGISGVAIPGTVTSIVTGPTSSKSTTPQVSHGSGAHPSAAASSAPAVVVSSTAPPPSTPAVSTTTTGPGAGTGAGTSTAVVNVSMFNFDGSLRKALTVTSSQEVRNNGVTATCGQSLYGVGPNVYRCGSTADNAPNCAGQPGTGDLYCLDDPVALTARHIHVDQPLAAVPAPEVSEPFELVLADGSTCGIRDGGTYDPRPDGWTAAYGCSGKTEYVLWKDGQPLVDQTGTTWFVMTGPLVAPADFDKPVAPPTRVDVATAYFVANGAVASTAISPAPSAPASTGASAYGIGPGLSGQTIYAFQSPSGNIRCLITDAELTCEMFTVNGIGPAGCANGPVEVTAVQGDPTVTVCKVGAGEPIRPVLDYGRSLTVYGYTCISSASAGIQCGEPGGHHMQLTKARIVVS